MKLSYIPIPPSINHAFPTAWNGRRFKSKAYTDWEKEFELWRLKNLIDVSKAKQEFKIKRPNYFLELHYYFYFDKKRVFCKDHTPKRFDLMNFEKILSDAIAKLIDQDDKLFFDVHCYKRICEPEEQQYVHVDLQWLKRDF